MLVLTNMCHVCADRTLDINKIYTFQLVGMSRLPTYVMIMKHTFGPNIYKICTRMCWCPNSQNTIYQRHYLNALHGNLVILINLG